MSLARALQQRLTDPNQPRSLSARSRAKRSRVLLERFPSLSQMTVLDLGGLPSFWRAAPERPAHVTTINVVDAKVEAGEGWLRHLVDDACGPTRLGDERFDLVISNSVIEHVGGYANRRRFAEVVYERADRHWIQTPYRYFPIEPHWAFPGLQFLPVPLRAAAVRAWPLGHVRLDAKEALDAVLATELLSVTEMRMLFPRSEIWREKLAGVTKSLVATRA